MLRVQNEREVEYLRLERRELSVLTEKPQEVLRGRKLRVGEVYEETLTAVVVLLGLVAVDRQEREDGDQLQALPEDVRDRDVVRVVVVRVEREDAS